MKKNLFRTLISLLLCAAFLCAGTAAYTDDGRIGDSYGKAVSDLSESGILDGFEDDSFHPEEILTREQSAKIVACLLLGSGAAKALQCEKAPFADVPVTLWSAPYVAWCVENGIIHGCDDGLFHPTDWLTGNQFAKMLLCALGIGRGEDYSGDNWPSAVIEDGYTAGLYEGDPDMASEGYLMRQQAALMVRNAMKGKEIVAEALPVSEDTGFGSAVIDVPEDEFNGYGFVLGDSCDVVFSNGYTLEDVPYYNGYYEQTGKPLICAYPGYGYAVIAFCNGPELWYEAGLQTGDTVTVTLRERGKYRLVQDTMNLVYSNDREDFESDEIFANFRVMQGGALRENMFYRGASPVDNKMSRAATVDGLLEKNGIRYVLDLADTEEKFAAFREQEDFQSDYVVGLEEAGNVSLLGMNSAFRSESFMTSLAAGLRDMMKHEGPVYIHCLEGKDRTGFVCALLEALAGASYDELLTDYMTTYENYYGLTEEASPEQYEAVVSLKFVDTVSAMGDLSPEDDDFSDSAAQYLLDCGMTGGEIQALRNYLCGE